MRAAVFVLFCGAAAAAVAQEQENKLVDRLLKPNLTLANSAQHQQFIPLQQTTAKSISPHEFGGLREKSVKEYSGQRAFVAWLLGRTREFPHNGSAVLSTRSDVPQKSFSTGASAARASTDAQKAVATADFSGERAVLDRGKSQKSLDAQRHQMSIDEVRELLNRNK